MYFASILLSAAQNPNVVAVTVATLMFCAGVKAMRSALRRTAAEAETCVAAQFQEMESTLAALRARIAEVPPPSPAGTAALEQGKRALALSMLQRGDSPEAVARTVGAARNEIELLRKVHRIVERQAS